MRWQMAHIRHLGLYGNGVPLQGLDAANHVTYAVLRALKAEEARVAALHEAE